MSRIIAKEDATDHTQSPLRAFSGSIPTCFE